MKVVLWAGPVKNDLRRHAAVGTALVLVAGALIGCGSSTGENGRGDAGISMRDAGPGANAQEGGSADGGPDCGAVAPAGTQILASPTQLVVKGLTYDGNYALYVDTGMQTLNAVPVAGGKAVTLGAYKTDGLQPTTTGALFYATINATTNVGPLWAWTPAAGANAISMTASASGGQDMSSDGSLVAFIAAAADGTGTLTLSTVDGKTQAPLVSEIDLQNCPVAVEFAGSALLAAYCLVTSSDSGAATDGGAPLETVSTFAGSGAPASFVQTIVGTFDSTQFGGYFIPVDPGGTQMLLVGVSGLALYPIAGGAPKPVDANGTAGALFAPNGDILYSTLSSGLSRYATATGMITPLLASGGYTPAAISSDGNWLQLNLNFDSNTGASDVFLSSATTAGTPLGEWTATTASVAGFSSDSTFELFVTGATTFKNTTYDFYASPVSGGKPAKVATVASLGWLPGSKMVLTDNYAAAGTADIEILDLAKPTTKKTLVTQADFNLQVTATNQIVYSWYCQPNSMAGIWVASAP